MPMIQGSIRKCPAVEDSIAIQILSIVFLSGLLFRGNANAHRNRRVKLNHLKCNLNPYPNYFLNFSFVIKLQVIYCEMLVYRSFCHGH
jgi:hypothetical protein